MRTKAGELHTVRRTYLRAAVLFAADSRCFGLAHSCRSAALRVRRSRDIPTAFRCSGIRVRSTVRPDRHWCVGVVCGSVTPSGDYCTTWTMCSCVVDCMIERFDEYSAGLRRVAKVLIGQNDAAVLDRDSRVEQLVGD